jgi:hypothetical protein
MERRIAGKGNLAFGSRPPALDDIAQDEVGCCRESISQTERQPLCLEAGNREVIDPAETIDDKVRAQSKRSCRFEPV